MVQQRPEEFQNPNNIPSKVRGLFQAAIGYQGAYAYHQGGGVASARPPLSTPKASRGTCAGTLLLLARTRAREENVSHPLHKHPMICVFQRELRASLLRVPKACFVLSYQRQAGTVDLGLWRIATVQCSCKGPGIWQVLLP